MKKPVKFISTFLICAVVVCLLSAAVFAGALYWQLSGICGTLELDGLEKPSGDVINVLALGVDGGELRTDTILLGSMNTRTKAVSLLSIPRDTRVLYNEKYDKITHLFSYDPTGQLTLDAVRELTGAEINYMLIINFDGFVQLIDGLGGIDIEVPDVNGTGGMYYDDPYQDLHIALEAGMQHLNGEEAEGFVRYRSGYANADLERISAQRYFLQELVRQKLTVGNILKAPALLSDLGGNLQTNYDAWSIVSQAFSMRKMNAENINSFSLPGESGTASTRYGRLSCFLYDEEETHALVQEYFSE